VQGDVGGATATAAPVSSTVSSTATTAAEAALHHRAAILLATVPALLARGTTAAPAAPIAAAASPHRTPVRRTAKALNYDSSASSSAATAAVISCLHCSDAPTSSIAALLIVWLTKLSDVSKPQSCIAEALTVLRSAASTADGRSTMTAHSAGLLLTPLLLLRRAPLLATTAQEVLLALTQDTSLTGETSSSCSKFLASCARASFFSNCKTVSFCGSYVHHLCKRCSIHCT
jgi:hypothetical protein